jgi:hypothetical protein
LLAIATDMKITYVLVFEPGHPLRFLVRVDNKVRIQHGTSAGSASWAAFRQIGSTNI